MDSLGELEDKMELSYKKLKHCVSMPLVVMPKFICDYFP